MGRDLFDGSGSDDAEELSKIEVNEEFARRYEHNKKREDLHRLEELVKSGRVSSSAATADGTSDDDSDDDEEDLAGSETEDLQFYEALVKVKKNDPAVLADKDAKLFDWDEKEGKEKEKRPKKERPLYLKDVNARNLLEGGPEFDEDETFSKKNQKSYSEEQDEIRREFLEAAEEAFEDGDDGDDDLLIEKKRIEEEPGDNVEIQERLNEYFGEDENLNENERFLKSFLVNKMWVDKEKGRRPAEEEVLEVSEDEEELEKQEKYEAKYNFRYEEGVGDRILGHARFMEGSVRKKENARKTQRKSKEDRLAQAEVERREELKRLKNVKKKEILEKLEKIRAIAGIGQGVECALDEEDLEEEFDPDEYDRRMRETFGDGYYEANDVNPDFKSDEEGDVEKPDFDKEDELLGLPKGWDVLSSGDGFLKVREKVLKRKQSEAVKEDGEAQEEEEEEEEDVEGKKKRKISLHDKVDLEKELEEYYKLDYEDTIGDLKTRFKYKSVPSNRYGLSGQEILMMEDKDLNQYVSLKKLVPYREDEWKIPRAKRYQQKKMKHVILQGGKLPDKKEKKKKKKGEDAGKSQLEKPDGEVGVESKRSRKRHRQSELKLSQSRLLAYGITQPESKAKKKH
ncbi:hypothetical protein QJS04_geneDACA003531 [Acorus gramineus]|uniref:Kri1-like C-terminal domain-containing protein n=1 Tax=Acorus gramineus TaxID=55184 RepID=A0AAV9BSA3_ACOGR|nr:hypothetical protein QJS04_geneDACA003531 [Acorus gramineus]